MSFFFIHTSFLPFMYLLFTAPDIILRALIYAAKSCVVSRLDTGLSQQAGATPAGRAMSQVLTAGKDRHPPFFNTVSSPEAVFLYKPEVWW